MDLGYIATVFGVIFFSMTLHEVMHGLVANALGDDTARLLGRLTLNPLKHIDPVMTVLLPGLIIATNAITGSAMPVFGGAKPVPFNPANIQHDEWGVALMAVSGPLTNLVIAFICFGIIAVAHIPSASIAGGVLWTAVSVNLGFFAFNILPIPPLDGSRVLYALAPNVVRTGLDSIERYGVVFVYLLVMLFGSFVTSYMTLAISWIVQLFAKIFGVV